LVRLSEKKGLAAIEQIIIDGGDKIEKGYITISPEIKLPRKVRRAIRFLCEDWDYAVKD
jgi:hypothetical protein